MDTFERFLEDCMSITTDMGTERLTADIGNCLRIFAAKIGLSISPKFASYKRLLEFCVAVPDWHHLVAWCLKASLEALGEWPDILSTLRAHCRFFRNASYRESLVVWLKSHGHGDYSKTLKCFSASFAKWRFETVLEVINSLNKVRHICSLFQPRMLGVLQDAQDFNEIVKHKGNTHFWRWVRGFHMMAHPIERFRTWATACPHPEHQEALKRGKSVQCEQLGRRLQEAPQRVVDLKTHLTDVADRLVLEDVLGDEAVFRDLSFALRRFLPEFKEKFAWVELMPYAFASATDQAVARSIIQQWEVSPRRDHHSMTLLLMDEFEVDVRRIADGCINDAPQRFFLAQVEAFRRIPLTSQVAEGYHRSTKLSKTRGGSSRLPWLLSSNRIWQNLNIVAALEDSPEGRACLECEFRRATRALQTKNALLLKRVKAPISKCVKRTYRLGEFNYFDWEELAADLVAVPPREAEAAEVPEADGGALAAEGHADVGQDGIPPAPENESALVELHGDVDISAAEGVVLKRSYLSAVIGHHDFFSVTVPDHDDPFLFQVLKVVTKPWLVVNPIRAQAQLYMLMEMQVV
ncbi:unnamed protein product [Prorocentrum cordatum]|uniref:Uncharacterized protein n=1 Tax=Prorocentrum cordatum TaxID=2364126 RepID=A0ABN9XKG3_9DINO|nr:unnamed protein product [Polarella glacialis]